VWVLSFEVPTPTNEASAPAHRSSDKLDRLNASLKEIDSALEEIKTCNQRVSTAARVGWGSHSDETTARECCWTAWKSLCPEGSTNYVDDTAEGHVYSLLLVASQITEAKGRYRKVCEREKAYMEKKANK